MKKKIVAAFTSLLLVVCACVSLVACGGKGIEGNWRSDIQSPRTHLYFEIKDEDLTVWYTKFGDEVTGGKATLSRVPEKDKCYEVTWSSGNKTYTEKITYLVLSSDNKLLAGSSSEIDSATASYVFNKTKISLSEWKREMVNDETVYQ